MKKCSKCGDIKEFSEFYKNKNTNDGFQIDCKTCVKKRKKELKTNSEMQLKRAIRQSIILENKLLKKDGKRICSCCKNIFEITSTHSICKECKCIHKKKYSEKNREHLLKTKKQYYENNKDKVKEYKEKNKEKILKYAKQYRLKKKLATS